MPRVYTRKFDYDEARRRHGGGESISALAAEYGVSRSRVQQVVYPEIGRAAYERADAYRWKCSDCGAPTRGKGRRCRPCAMRIAATTVREDELQCATCRQWKDDEDFPSNRSEPHRRGRAGQCRICQTDAKRAWRAKNPDYEREYMQRRRAAA